MVNGKMKNKKVLIPVIVLLPAVVIALLVWNAANKKEEVHKQTRFLMDTICTLQAYGPAGPTNAALKLALDRMEEVYIKFDVNNPQSPLYEFNRKGIPVVDKEIIAVVEKSLEISRKSGGAFDITVFPLINLWGFYTDNPVVPKEVEVKECLKKMGYNKLIITEKGLIKTDPNVQVELGGIAKGYAIDETIKKLKELGITSALIDAGGDVYALGKLNKDYWKIGIRNPRGSGVIGVLEAEDKAVVTSGDYERFFEENGVRYHHILNTKTGYPAQGLVSVTVISTNAIVADAWSTTLFVLGMEKGMELVENTDDLEALLIASDGKVACSTGLLEDFEETENKGEKSD